MNGEISNKNLLSPLPTDSHLLAKETKTGEKITQVKISVIARGIGFGDQLDYADQMTITHALQNRRPMK